MKINKVMLAAVLLLTLELAFHAHRGIFIGLISLHFLLLVYTSIQFVRARQAFVRAVETLKESISKIDPGL